MEKKANAKTENHQISKDKKGEGIKLKNPIMLATKYDHAEINDVCYALIFFRSKAYTQLY